jgi:hypothetical protein
MLGHMGRVGESGRNLILGELIVFPDIFSLVPCSQSAKYSGDIDTGTLNAWFAETNCRVHCNAGINFHRSLHKDGLYPIHVEEFQSMKIGPFSF